VGAVIKMTIPSLHSVVSGGASGESETDSSKHRVSFLRASGTLFMSIAWIAMLAWCLIGVSETLIAHMDVGTSTVGATLVALGSEIPDTIASIALARSGYNDGAMAGAIGSQVINITLGVGLPVLLSCWLTGHNIKINMKQTRSLWLLTALMVVVIGGYVAITIPMHMIWRQLQCNAIKYTRMGRKGAWGLLVVLAVVTVAFVWLNEEVMDEINDDVVTKLAKPLREGQ
jgi:Ca2+/Na+ antiporter